MTPTMHAVVIVRCRSCYELVPGNVGAHGVLIQTHREPNSDARCTGSKSLVPTPATEAK